MAPDDPKPRAAPWDVEAARRRAGLTVPDWLGAFSARGHRLVSEWAIAEVAPGRLLPWLPVAFGTGIALYFTADREPAWWAASSLALATIAIAAMARRRPFGFPLALAVAATATGFCVATLQTARVAHPILQRATWRAQLAGFVESREEHDKSDRIVVRVSRFEAPRVPEKPERVRVAVRKGTAPDVGRFCRAQGPSVPAVAAVTARRLRLRARYVFPTDRRLRLCARQDQGRAAAIGVQPVAALCRLHRYATRRHQPPHS